MSTEQERLSQADGQDQELDRDKQEGCVTAEPGASSAGDVATTKEKESLNGGSDLVSGTTKESEKKEEVSEVNGEKDSGGIQTKEEEPDMKQGTKAENFDDVECFMGLDPYESKNESALDNDDNAPVTLKEKLSESDLVWAKVRSHPWWPGQVFDTSAASDKAKKHFKKGSFLVTYFGDCSFAWNDASKIKPFRQQFSQMAKQSSLPGFLDAVEFALEEVARRVEFGLACSCISEEVYEKVKSQKVINPGIREDSSRVHGGDKVSGAVFFEPAKLVEYVKRLACLPSYDASSSDELQFVSQRARLLAFSRWKGYTELPEFETLQGSVESAIKMTHTEKEVKESAPEPKESKQVYTKRRKTEEKDQCKPDGVFEYEDTTTTVPKKKKKEKTLAEFIAEKRLSKSRGKKRSHENSDGEKKRKVVHSEPLKSSAKKTKTEDSGSPASLKSAKKTKTEDSGPPASPRNEQKITPKKAKTSFGIGASILRVANQMHCSTPATGLVSCSKNNGSGKSKPEALSVREPSPKETHSSRRSNSTTTKASSGKATPISIDKVQSGELERVVKETPSTDLVGDSRDLKGSTEKHMVSEDRKEAANIVGEMITEDSKLTEEKEHHVNKNSPGGSVS